MAENYQQFRRSQLAELRAADPGLSYRQILKIISEKWNTVKIANNAVATPEEIMAYVSSPFSEVFVRRLRYTIENVGREEFLKLEFEGDNLFIQFMRKAVKTWPDKCIFGLLVNMMSVEEFYETRDKAHAASALDVCIALDRPSTVLHILSRSPSWVFKNLSRSSDQSMMGCLINCLCKNYNNRDLHTQITDILRKLIHAGTNPNLELADAVKKSDHVESLYLQDPVYRRLSGFLGPEKDKMDQFIRYVGSRDHGMAFRERMGTTPEEITSITKNDSFVGETLFSIFYEHVRDHRCTTLCDLLLKNNIIDMNTVLVPRKLGFAQTYLSLFLKRKLRSKIEHGFTAFLHTPSYMFYLPSGGFPLEVLFKNIRTTWDGKLLTLPTVPPVIGTVFERFLIKPTKGDLELFATNEVLIKSVIDYYNRIPANEPVYKHIIETFPEVFPTTCLAKILLTPVFLEKIAGGLKAGNWKQHLTKETMLEACSQHPFLKTEVDDSKIVNEWFIYNGSSVKDRHPGLPIFVTDDNYAFSVDELGYLLDKMENPFNRRKLTDDELEKVGNLYENYDEWWFLYPHIDLGLTADGLKLSVNKLAEKIDEMIDNCPFFVYGERLSPHVGKLNSMDRISTTYLCLMTGPLILNIGIDNMFINSCVNFQTQDTVDHSTIEEINIFFGILLAKCISDPRSCNVQESLVRLLTWVLCVLEKTFENSTQELFNGRVFTLYVLIENYLKRLT
jgi:hypothetical protein